MKENFAQQLASREFSFQSKKAGHELIQQSYDNLKNNQLQLVEMNKKLILTHSEETARLEASISEYEKELTIKTNKL
jgi:hypothetical protein